MSYTKSIYLNHVLEEMCIRVSADPTKINFKAPQWYHEHEWTKEQEAKFIEWMADFLYNSKEAREELLEFPRKNRKYCKQVAGEFVWKYGWKYEEDKDG